MWRCLRWAAMVAEAERLAEMLEAEGHSVAVINARFAKPVDAECVAEYGARCELLVTMEDHVLAGGFGSAVLEMLNALRAGGAGGAGGMAGCVYRAWQGGGAAREVWTDGGGCAGEGAAVSEAGCGAVMWRSIGCEKRSIADGLQAVMACGGPEELSVRRWR